MALRTDGKPTIQLDEEQAIAVREVNATAHLALQHDQLVSERGILCFKPALRLEERGNHLQARRISARPFVLTLCDSATQ